MNAAPRLSIGLPVYNGENYLAEALDALLGQSYSDFELVVSDNASTDGTEEICRDYAARDKRIRYLRQPVNIGAGPNHNLVFHESRGELYKWASHDDLYGRDLLLRCVEALDARPDVVLAHAWQAIIDGDGNVVLPVDYPLATDDPRAPARFRSMLFAVGGDDFYGVIRSDVLRQTPLQQSYHHADRTIVSELALHGPFYQVPEILYFRRDHPDRAERATPDLRARCANLDPRRANRLRNPAVRLLAEYIWGFISAIRRAPLSSSDRRKCYQYLALWMASRALPGSSRRIEDSASSTATSTAADGAVMREAAGLVGPRKVS
ncbi:MAG TPA: glycosyltransferase family 2 protein [Kribbella sp.]|nr:glycosyltransferase family 2 protein [Kribbella sp.]